MPLKDERRVGAAEAEAVRHDGVKRYSRVLRMIGKPAHAASSSSMFAEAARKPSRIWAN
jgi:hypothetical protein